MEDCIFCKIIKGEIPCYKIYEDEKVLAFLDIHALSKGHILVVPKKHVENIFEVETEELKALILVVQKLSRRIKEKLNPEGINILQRNGRGAGQEVPHFHFHIVPRYAGDTVTLPATSEYKTKNLDELVKLLTK